jgi:uncharacterized membrane protein YoaK (UPF0700 family)
MVVKNVSSRTVVPHKSILKMIFTYPSARKTASQRRDHLHQDLRTSPFLISLLFILALAIGIQDATTFPTYHTFASNQTGNTVLLAVATLSLMPTDILPGTMLGLSLGMFVAGAIVQGQAGNLMDCARRRWWILLSNVVQTVMVFAAAVLEFHLPYPPTGPVAMGVIALLAFSSGAQVGMVRGIGITEITTAMATAAYIDVAVDKDVLAPWSKNRIRNRRLGFLVTLIIGSFIGAAVDKQFGTGVALVVSGGLKAVVTLLVLVVEGDHVDRPGDVEYCTT